MFVSAALSELRLGPVLQAEEMWGRGHPSTGASELQLRQGDRELQTCLKKLYTNIMYDSKAMPVYMPAPNSKFMLSLVAHPVPFLLIDVVYNPYRCIQMATKSGIYEA